MKLHLIPQAYASCNPTGDQFNLFDCLTLSSGEKMSEVYDKPADIINLIVRNLFVFAAIILMFYIIGAGYAFIMSDSGKAKEKAQSSLTAAVAGLILMIAAYWIVQLIQKITGAPINI